MIYNSQVMKKFLTDLLNRLRAPGGPRFMSDVYKIVGGTGLAQLLTALGMPILSRMYSESTFGTATLFTSTQSDLWHHCQPEIRSSYLTA